MEKDLQERIDFMAQEIKRLRKQLAASRQIEASLRENEARFRSIFDYTSIGLAQLGPDSRFLEVNPPFCAIFGYSRDELLRLACDDITHPDERQNDAEIRRQLLAGEIPFATWEKRCIRKDGTVIWTNLNLSISHSPDGKTKSLLAAMENISDRKMLQESLGRIATDLAKADVISLSGTWKWNLHTNEVTASEEIFHIFELPPSRSAVPINVFMGRIHPEHRPSVEQMMQAVASGQKSLQIECCLLLPDGAHRLISISGERYSETGRRTHPSMIGVIRDITRRKNAEKALKESEQRFRQLFDSAVDGIFIADFDGKYIDVNPSACRMLGYSRDEILKKSIRDLVRDSDMERFLTAKTYLLQNRQHFHVDEWALKRQDGEYIETEVSTRILPDNRWLSDVHDITERKRAQRELEQYAAEVRDLYDNAPCGYHSLDRDGVLVQINRTELAWLGYDRDELIGKKKFTDLLAEESRNRFNEHFPGFVKSGLIRDLEFELIRKNGTILPVLLSASAVMDEQGNYVTSRSTVFDMTEMAEAQKKLRQAAAVFEHTNDAIIITNADGTIVAVNNAFSDITGYRPEEVLGKNPRLLKSERQDDEFYRNLWNSLDQTGKWQGEVWDRRKSGALFPAWETITSVRDNSGKVTDYIAVFSDITTLKQSEEKLLKLAYHDPLTGLPNRLLFNDRMAQAIAHAKRHQTRAVLLLLDLDRFKYINDTLGHATGDRLLQLVGIRLKGAVREEDTVARLGGDEFAVILTQLDNVDDAALFAKKLIGLVSQPIDIDDQTLTVSTSIGIGVYPDDGHDTETLSKAADMAMYGAKGKGGNAYDFYTHEMTRTSTEALTVDRDLRNALKLNELELYYQPQVNLSSGRIVGIEALVRWNSPNQGLQHPGKFIPIAEETDLIELIGEWVFHTACTQLQKWHKAGLPPIRLAVNVSARQIKKPHFLEDVRRKLMACQPLEGFGLDIEITETVLQTGPDVVEALKEMKSLGVKIAIDDFGTGYSSLNSLKHLPIDILKIDRSFIDGIPGDSGDKAIASAIIAMGHSLDMSIIAEGVETPDQLQFVMDQHCDEAQGFLFFPPLPLEECERYLKFSNTTSIFKVFEAQQGRS